MMGSVIKAIWNGPFHVGKLERPVSTGDALMKLFETIWRLGIVAIVFVYAVLVIFRIIDSINDYSRPVTDAPEEWTVAETTSLSASDVEASAAINADRCPAGYPVVVTLKNNGTQTLGSAHFSFVVQRVGRSSNLAPNTWHLTDAIVQPGGARSTCWPLPPLPENVREADLSIQVVIQSVEPIEPT